MDDLMRIAAADKRFANTYISILTLWWFSGML
jgi:hypothetical protein